MSCNVKPVIFLSLLFIIIQDEYLQFTCHRILHYALIISCLASKIITLQKQQTAFVGIHFPRPFVH